MISDGKARQKNVTGDETKLIQVQKGLSSTISKNRLMDLKKPNVFLKTPSYLTTFPTNCDEYPVVFCCNDCAQMFFKLRAGQMHQCIKKHPGRKVKC
ncbi:Hypothetical protein NTJ_03022 [Nesidiocoris tenuis]|uniref:C2H2-type domain-containing protein n=1 Tax=Nesidiocoris tenuis TaxID=355587 RepID=A0ABN7AFS2_9HEMI|nr:Hypothetical protein NTJ_03022 [Nesidiocoris tenuis]